jgi:hypothetical protein
MLRCPNVPVPRPVLASKVCRSDLSILGSSSLLIRIPSIRGTLAPIRSICPVTAEDGLLAICFAALKIATGRLLLQVAGGRSHLEKMKQPVKVTSVASLK